MDRKIPLHVGKDLNLALSLSFFVFGQIIVLNNFYNCQQINVWVREVAKIRIHFSFAGKKKNKGSCYGGIRRLLYFFKISPNKKLWSTKFA